MDAIEQLTDETWVVGQEQPDSAMANVQDIVAHSKYLCAFARRYAYLISPFVCENKK